MMLPFMDAALEMNYADLLQTSKAAQRIAACAQLTSVRSLTRA